MEPGDIVQITDESHPWFPCLLVVDEVKSWGVQAYVTIPKSNNNTELPGQAYNRLPFKKIKKVGAAVITLAEHNE